MAKPRAAAPSRFVALLRGVNVGKANRVPMAELRRILEAQGFVDVQTLLNSGNAVFGAGRGTSAEHAVTISTCLQNELGVTARVVVKSAAEFGAAVNGMAHDLPVTEHSRFLVAFAASAEGLQGLGALLPKVQAPERLEIGQYAAYLHCANGILESPVATAMLGKHGREVTTRNWATVLKLHAMLA